MKKTKVIITIILAITVLCIFAGCGTDEIQNEIKFETKSTSYTLSEDGVLEVKGSGAITDINVEKSKVRKVIIETGVTEIGDRAFADMSNLEEIEISETVETIGDNAFQNCTSIKEIEIPDNVKEIADNAFSGWEEGQKIISSWYEGAVKYWNEWYSYWQEFKNDENNIKKFEDLEEEVKTKMALWWQEWLEKSEYWKENCPTQEEIEEKKDQWWGYWVSFGNYLKSEQEDICEEPEEMPDEEGEIPQWWTRVKEIGEYLKKHIIIEEYEITEEEQEKIEKQIEDTLKKIFGEEQE